MKVRVVAPGRQLPPEAAEKLRGVARAYPDVTLEIDEQCFAISGHFAGTDDQRAEAFVRAANDPSVDAVWFARGGYGACRLIGSVLPRLEGPARLKSYLGYSDGGYLLAALACAGIGRSVHAPMVADGLRPGGEEALTRVLRFLQGREEAEAPAYAFNLAVLASIVATPHCPSFDGEIVAVEEVDEHLYAIDRMLYTVLTSRRLGGARGLKLGRVSGIPENDIAFQETPEGMIRRWCLTSGIPYLGAAPIGHDSDNRIVPFPLRRGLG